MPFSLKIDTPYKAAPQSRQRPADIQDFRQNGRWQHRKPVYGTVTAYAMSSAVIFALGMGVSSYRLGDVVMASAYDMTPTGSIAKPLAGDAVKARSCDEQARASTPGAAAR